MNEKIKDYDKYIENIKIDNLKFGDYIIDSSKIVKKILKKTLILQTFTENF